MRWDGKGVNLETWQGTRVKWQGREWNEIDIPAGNNCRRRRTRDRSTRQTTHDLTKLLESEVSVHDSTRSSGRCCLLDSKCPFERRKRVLSLVPSLRGAQLLALDTRQARRQGSPIIRKHAHVWEHIIFENQPQHLWPPS